ncbi:MAG: hypothetical protein Q8O03_02635 [Nanoarchaeota archaeon]|nr:hypothetical protein [Nanoarchaeota archaeon]
MAKMKKGVLFTLGITMLVTIVFSLAVLLFHNTQSMEERFSELVLLDRISDCDGMVQSNIRDINAYESGLYITVGNNNVSFTEAFPRSDKFAEVMEEYEDYMKTNYTAANITFDDTKMSQIKDKQLMYIMPYRIRYEHDNGYPGEAYVLVPGTNYNKISGYNITLKVNAVSAALSLPETTITQGGTFDLGIYIKSSSGTTLYAQEWTDINHKDPSPETTVKINIFNAQGTDIGDIIIKVKPEAYLDVDPPASITKTSILEIALTEPGAQEGPVEVKYDPEGIFTIHFEEAKLIKRGTVKLA